MILEQPSLPSGPILTSNVPSSFSTRSSSLVITMSSLRSEPYDNVCKELLFTLQRLDNHTKQCFIKSIYPRSKQIMSDQMFNKNRLFV